MKRSLIILIITFASFSSKAIIHIVPVWDGYFQFVGGEVTMQLGDTIQWLPLDVPSMVHTITSTNIPSGAETFDQIWQAPADTFFQYIPEVIGLYEYECTPHAVSYNMVGSFNVMGANGIADEHLSEGQLLVYPNPTVDWIYFKESSVIYPFHIYSPKGQLVLSGTTDDAVNVSGLAKGMYHIRIMADKPRVSQFIKQ